MRMWIAIALLACSGMALASRQPPKAAGQIAPKARLPNAEALAARDEERGTDERPLIVKNYPQTTATASAEAEEDRTERANTDWWVVVIGKASIGVGILTAIILVIQAYFIRSTVQITSESDEHQLRAYVLPLHTGAIISADATGRVRITVDVKIKNSGKTPASKLKYWAAAGIRNYPHADFADNPEPVAEAFLAPDGIFANRFILGPYDQSAIKDITDSKTAIYAFGKAEYETFGLKRFTSFRVVCVGDNVDLVTGFCTFNICAEGNDYT